MQSVMCYMGLVTCYVKALLSMGKQGTKSLLVIFQTGLGPFSLQCKTACCPRMWFLNNSVFRAKLKRSAQTITIKVTSSETVAVSGAQNFMLLNEKTKTKILISFAQKFQKQSPSPKPCTRSVAD